MSGCITHHAITLINRTLPSSDVLHDFWNHCVSLLHFCSDCIQSSTPQRVWFTSKQHFPWLLFSTVNNSSANWTDRSIRFNNRSIHLSWSDFHQWSHQLLWAFALDPQSKGKEICARSKRGKRLQGGTYFA